MNTSITARLPWLTSALLFIAASALVFLSLTAAHRGITPASTETTAESDAEPMPAIDDERPASTKQAPPPEQPSKQEKSAPDDSALLALLNEGAPSAADALGAEIANIHIPAGPVPAPTKREESHGGAPIASSNDGAGIVFVGGVATVDALRGDAKIITGYRASDDDDYMTAVPVSGARLTFREPLDGRCFRLAGYGSNDYWVKFRDLGLLAAVEDAIARRGRAVIDANGRVILDSPRNGSGRMGAP